MCSPSQPRLRSRSRRWIKAQASVSAFRPALALFLPLRIAPLQEIFGAGTAQMRAAILHHHLAIDIAGLVGNQKARQVSKFAMLAGAAERIALRPAFIAALGTELARSAGRRKRAEADDGEGQRGRLRQRVLRPAQFLCAAQELSESQI